MMLKRYLYILIGPLVIGVIVGLTAVPMTTMATEVPFSFTYQGRILNPDSTPLENSSVTFNIQVRSGGAERCLLYEEQFTINMSTSGGNFTLPIGEGARVGSSYEDTSTIAEVFKNDGVVINSLTCDTGTSYTPTSGDRRYLRVSFDPGTGYESLDEDIAINSVPFSVYASRLNGKSASEFIQVKDDATYDLNQTNMEQVFTTANYTELMALINGTSSQYAGGSSFAPSSSVSFNGQNITSVADPVSDQDVATKKYVDDSLSASGLGDITDVTASTGLSGGGTSGNVSLSLAAGGVAATHLASDSVTTIKILDGEVGSADLATDAVTTAKIAAGAVTDAKIASGISASKITDGSGSGLDSDLLDGQEGTYYLDYGNLTNVPSTFSPSAHGHYYSDLLNNTGVYFSYMPNSIECTNGQVLKWNATSDQWLCDNDTDTGVTSESDPTVLASVKDGVSWSEIFSMPADFSDGSVTWTEVASKPSTFTPTAHTHGIDELTSGTGLYFSYMPNNVECSDSQVLKWNATANQWLCDNDTDTDSGGDISGVTAGTGLSGGGTSGAVSLSLANTAVTAGSYTRASITVDAQGRLTAASSGSAIDLTSDVTGTLPVANGGTGVTSLPGTFVLNGGQAGSVSLGPSDANSLTLQTSGLPGMTILPSGNIGIGTASPSGKLEVAGDTSAVQTIIRAAGTYPELYLTRAGGTIASPTATQSGDIVGRVVGGGHDGSSYGGNVAGMWIRASESFTSIAQGTAIEFWTTPEGSTITAQRMTINSSGNVGIGTTSPSGTVHLNATSPKQIWSRGGITEFQIIDYTDGHIYADYKNNFYFRNGIGGVGNTYPLTLLSSGNVGIGTNSPNSLLDVNGVIRAQQICDETGANCVDISGGWSSGSVTSVTGGTGLTGGTITSTGTLAVDVGTTASKIVQLDGSAKLPAVDGSQLTNVVASSVSGTVGVANGGTGATSFAADKIIMSNGTGSALIATSCATDQVLVYTLTGWACESKTAGSVTSVGASTPLSSSGGATPTISIANATTAAAGAMSAADKTKLDGLAAGADITGVTAGTGLSGGGTSGDVTVNLADTAVTAGSYTRANITVDAQGRLTAASNSGAVNLASEVTGVLPVANGGTGATSLSGTFVLNGGQAGIVTLGPSDANDLTLQTGGTAKMTVDASGNVGIGISSLTEKLEVNGTVKATNLLLTSDAKFKTEINPLEDSLYKVLKLEGVEYFWDIEGFPEKDFTNKKQIGFIAQEVRKIYPEAVYETKEGELGINYPALIPPVVEAIKEIVRQQKFMTNMQWQLQAENRQLKREVSSLREENLKLQERLERIERWIEQQE